MNTELNSEILTLFATLLATILGANAFLWNKLDRIWHAIGNLRQESVTHEECRRRRRNADRR